jgi:hypothetical protein
MYSGVAVVPLSIFLDAVEPGEHILHPKIKTSKLGCKFGPQCLYMSFKQRTNCTHGNCPCLCLLVKGA